MKKILLSLMALVLLGVAGAGIGAGFLIKSFGAPGPLPETKIVLIERGKGIAAIAQKLEDETVVSSALAFKLATQMDADPRPLKAGEYQFAASISLAETLEMLRAGKVYDRKVTIPEGYTSWQIVSVLRGLQDLSGEITDIPEEGTLLPETYHYLLNDSRMDIIGRMQENMRTVLDGLWNRRAPDLPLKDKNEVLTLASIVEKETGVAAERAKIAGVFVNRLRRGMPLQSDPTVIYGMTQGEIQTEGQGPIGRRLLRKDLEVDNPYNTYKRTGLPPGPIANPGRDSIAATLNPERHEYYYFVADGTGGHVFAKTLAEHNRNVAQWRKIRRERGL